MGWCIGRWVGALVGFVAAPAYAAGPVTEADCDHLLEPDVPSANGIELGIQPGDVVCVRAGQREFLRLYDFVGTPEDPITVTNLGGQVEIDNADRGYGLTGDRMAHVRITGTGDARFEHGFKVRASREGPDYSASGVVFGDLSTNYELDHFEVYETGFAGFSLKTEPRCDQSANLGVFTQYETSVHDNWVHDTRGEGMYLGSTGYGGREYDCDGTPTVLHPHEHIGFYVHHNVIERTGWDGVQIGVTPMNCEVHHNEIRDVGLLDEQFQANGLQIGGASSCAIWANRLENGPTNGMIILDAADTFVHDNVVVGFAATGIYLNDRQIEAVAGSSYALVHNTIAQIGGDGLALFAATTSGHVGKNNLLVDVTGTPLAIGGNVDWTAEANVESTASEVGFVDAAARDFRLRSDAIVVDAGVDIAPYEAPVDLAGVERDASRDVGAYEWTDDPPPGGDTGDGGGTDGGSDGGSDDGPGRTTGGGGGEVGGNADTGGRADESGTGGGSSSSAQEDEGAESGCACRATSSGRAGWGPWGLMLVGLVGLSRRRARTNLTARSRG